MKLRFPVKFAKFLRKSLLQNDWMPTSEMFFLLDCGVKHDNNIHLFLCDPFIWSY